MPRTTTTTTIRRALFAAAFAVAVPGLTAAAHAQDAEDNTGQTIIEGQQERTTDSQNRQDRERRQNRDASGQDRDTNRGDMNRDAYGQDRGMDREMKTLEGEKLTKWFEYAASGNQFEVEAAKLAQDRLQNNPRLLSVAQRIEQDHTRALENLRAQAERAGVSLSRDVELTPVNQAQLEALQQQEDEQEFANAYLFGQDAAHRETILWYSDAKSGVANPEIQAFVTEALPTVEQHYRQIRQLANQTAGVEQARGRNGMNRSGDAMDDAADDMNDAMDDMQNDMQDGMGDMRDGMDNAADRARPGERNRRPGNNRADRPRNNRNNSTSGSDN